MGAAQDGDDARHAGLAFWDWLEFWHKRRGPLQRVGEASRKPNGDSLYGLGEGGSQFEFLTGGDGEVGAGSPDFIIDQDLEGDGVFDFLRPAPGLAINAGKGDAAFPSEAGALATQEERIAKADVQFDVDDGLGSVRIAV